MALPLFQIGPFQFFSLSEPPQTPSEMADIIQRPGVAGTGFMKTGKKGEPFELTSSVDLADKYVAHAVASSYHSLEHAGTYDIVHSDVSYSFAGVAVVVMSVRTIAIKNLRTVAGGLNGGNAWLTARWKLMPVIVPTP